MAKTKQEQITDILHRIIAHHKKTKFSYDELANIYSKLVKVVPILKSTDEYETAQNFLHKIKKEKEEAYKELEMQNFRSKCAHLIDENLRYPLPDAARDTKIFNELINDYHRGKPNNSRNTDVDTEELMDYVDEILNNSDYKNDSELQIMTNIEDHEKATILNDEFFKRLSRTVNETISRLKSNKEESHKPSFKSLTLEDEMKRSDKLLAYIKNFVQIQNDDTDLSGDNSDSDSE